MAKETITTPIRINTAGRITETTVLSDRKVVKNFLAKTALNCLAKEKEQITLGSTKLSISGIFPVLSSL